ncbi:hypothetical protein F3Y22_tig00004072pilonHSYRG00092 [Hibiscus syriacus]|uniref:Uncharacterized protein n=1 Tax=Hibiscus syriacus TaxID=106335 RepID=A0A6A3CJT2_HIBSY|nr:hypothetical protein F3Y22_tig00004072pilonHSYRG00092 [Hibiscus syriacus]
MEEKENCYRTLSLLKKALLLHQTSPPTRGTWSGKNTLEKTQKLGPWCIRVSRKKNLQNGLCSRSMNLDDMVVSIATDKWKPLQSSQDLHSMVHSGNSAFWLAERFLLAP